MTIMETQSLAQDDLVDLIDDSIIVRKLDGVIVRWNAASERIYGYSAAEAIGQDADRLLQSHHLFTMPTISQTVLEKGVWEGELQRTASDGRQMTVEARWTLRSGDAGEPRDIVEIGRDVSTLSALEIETRLAAHRYRNLFQAMAASFWELDFTLVRSAIADLIDGGVADLRLYFANHPEWVEWAMKSVLIVDVNDTTIELFGAVRRDELVGRNVAWIWPEESRGIFVESLMAAVEQRDRFAAETALFGVDRRRIECLFTVCWPEQHKGRGNVLVGVIDLTERVRAEADWRRSETRYRELFHSIPVGLALLDNRRFRAMLDQVEAEGPDALFRYVAESPDFIEKALATVIPIEVNDHLIQLLGAETREQVFQPVSYAWTVNPGTVRRGTLARLRGATSYSEETKIKTLDGRVIDVLYAVAFTTEWREMGINTVAFVDISDRVAAQAMVERVRADFAHAARVSMLGELTASIAHEVNQPLAAIVASGEAGLRWLSRREPNTDEVRSLTARMVADARRAAGVIDRVRDMASNRSPQHAPVSLYDIVEDSANFLHHELEAHGVSLELAFGDGLGKARADRIQLQQVIVNLAVNAVQAMSQAATPRPMLRIGAASDAGDRILITIEDNGPGIPPEIAERLFDSFFTTKADGLGIGLSICQTIVEGHGGLISAGNRPEGGARFTVSIPIADQHHTHA